MTNASCTSISSTRPPCRATIGLTWVSNSSATRSYRVSSSAPPAATGADDDTLYDRDRKSTRLNSSHDQMSYAVFCLKKKKRESPTKKCPRSYHDSHNTH